MRIFHYNVEQYYFKTLIEELFDFPILEDLHECLTVQYEELFTRDKDSATELHKRFYAKLKEPWHEFEQLYISFIKNTIHLPENEPFIYQTLPTFRVHLPNNVAVGNWHKDSTYNHPVEEINFILPLTKCFDTNTVWVETEPDKGDFKPIVMDYGDLFMFSGGTLEHGNKENLTEKTRVSLDFRILPRKYYNPNGGRSVTQNTRFIIGEYYSEP